MGRARLWISAGTALVIAGVAGCGSDEVTGAIDEAQDAVDNVRAAADAAEDVAEVVAALQDIDPALALDPQTVLAGTRKACAALDRPEGRSAVEIIRHFYGDEDVRISKRAARELADLLDATVCDRVQN